MVLKTSQKSNEFYAGRVLKQIEKAFSDLGCFEMFDFDLEMCSDLMVYLGYAGDQLAFKERIMLDAYKFMGGQTHGEHRKNITKRSFIVFVNAINNVFLQWMRGSDESLGEDLKVKSD